MADFLLGTPCRIWFISSDNHVVKHKELPALPTGALGGIISRMTQTQLPWRLEAIHPQAQRDKYNWCCKATHVRICYSCLLSAGLVDE